MAAIHLHNTIQYSDGRYAVSWHWKSNADELPSNFDITFTRMKSLARRLQNDRPLLEKYDGVIQDQVTMGIIEKVNENEVQGTRLHYLPHQPVLTPSKTTTKLRIVYDASSKSKRGALSLNDCLHRGPTLLPSLCGVLMRYRTYPIAILADIEKAFLQFTVQRHDRDVTHFL